MEDRARTFPAADLFATCSRGSTYAMCMCSFAVHTLTTSAAACSSDGSGGTVFLQTRSGAFCVKGSMRIAEETFALVRTPLHPTLRSNLPASLAEILQELFRVLGVRVPAYRLLSHVDSEWRDLKHAVYAAAALYERNGEEIVAQRLGSTGLKSLQRAQLLVMEIITNGRALDRLELSSSSGWCATGRARSPPVQCCLCPHPLRRPVVSAAAARFSPRPTQAAPSGCVRSAERWLPTSWSTTRTASRCHAGITKVIRATFSSPSSCRPSQSTRPRAASIHIRRSPPQCVSGALPRPSPHSHCAAAARSHEPRQF